MVSPTMPSTRSCQKPSCARDASAAQLGWAALPAWMRPQHMGMVMAWGMGMGMGMAMAMGHGHGAWAWGMGTAHGHGHGAWAPQ